MIKLNKKERVPCPWTYRPAWVGYDDDGKVRWFDAETEMEMPSYKPYSAEEYEQDKELFMNLHKVNETKITFYPRDIGLWRNHFDFSNPSKAGKHFRTKDELVDYLSGFVRMDDPDYPLTFSEPEEHTQLGEGVVTIKQWTVVGWYKENY